MPSWRSIGNILLLMLLVVIAAYAAVSIYGLSTGHLELEKVREPLGYALVSVVTLLANSLAKMIETKIAKDAKAPK